MNALKNSVDEFKSQLINWSKDTYKKCHVAAIVIMLTRHMVYLSLVAQG